MRGIRLFTMLALLPTIITGAMAAEAPDNAWVHKVGKYPLGMTDPFHDSDFRAAMLNLSDDEVQWLQVNTANWSIGPDWLYQLWDQTYSCLRVGFDAHTFDSQGRFAFDNALLPYPHPPPITLSSDNKTYSIHVDRYSSPAWDGNHAGVIVLVHGTGSYAGCYMAACMYLAVVRGYIVYAPDLLSHGRSHNHKLIKSGFRLPAQLVHWRMDTPIGNMPAGVVDGQSDPNARLRALQEQKQTSALLNGYAEKEPATFSMEQHKAIVQCISRLAAAHEGVDHVTLLGTSQGGEVSFWSAIPDQGQNLQGLYQSVISHDIYNTAMHAPNTRMRLLRAPWSGKAWVKLFAENDSLWENTNWGKYYSNENLRLRAGDRYVRWRYDMKDYRELLLYANNEEQKLRNLTVPLLVAIGDRDQLYDSFTNSIDLVKRLFEGIDPTSGLSSERLWYIRFRTPQGLNGHQLLVEQTIPFCEMTHGWVLAHQQPPVMAFQPDPNLWRIIFPTARATDAPVEAN